jgi:hypothetical protein
MAGQNCQFGYATEHIATTFCTEIVPWTSFFLEKRQSLWRLTCYKFLPSVVCRWPVGHSGSFLGVPKPARNGEMFSFWKNLLFIRIYIKKGAIYFNFIIFI